MSTSSGKSNETVSTSEVDFDEAAGSRRLPEFHDWLKFRNIFGWLFGFVEHYFRSRNYRGALLAVPFIIMGIAGPAFLWWLKGAPQTHSVVQYEQTLADALKSDDHETARVCLESLVRLRPQETSYRFQLALQLLEHGQPDAGLVHLQPLLDPGPSGYNPARLWLVRQLGQQKPLIQVTPEIAETQLKLILETDPLNLEANSVLAGLHISQQQLKLAEARLLRVVDRVPALCLNLVKVQLRMGRSQEQIQFHLTSALTYYEDILFNDASNEDARISYAESLSIAQRPEDAARILSEGMKLSDSNKLKTALSLLYLQISQKQLAASETLNRDNAMSLLVKASALSPGNRDITNGLLRLIGRGARVEPASLKPTIDWLLSENEPQQQDNVLLARLLTFCRRYDEALVALGQVSDDQPERQVIQATIHLAAGDTDRAQQLIADIVDRFRKRKSELDSAEAAVFANTLVLGMRFEEAYQFLQPYFRQPPVEDTASPSEDLVGDSAATPKLKNSFAIVCVRLFDQRINDEAYTDGKAAMRLLEEAIETNVEDIVLAVVDRLAELALDKSARFSADADQMLNRLLAGGYASKKTYGLVGTKALGKGNVAEARKYLERAYSLDRTNLVTLNNLALAIVRQNPVDKADGERALQLVETVLEVAPQNRDALSTQGEVFVALQRWEEARNSLELSMLPASEGGKQSGSMNSHNLLVTVFDALNEPERADQHRQILQQMNASQAIPK